MDRQDFINTCTENGNLNISFYDNLNTDRDLEFLPGTFWKQSTCSTKIWYWKI